KGYEPDRQVLDFAHAFDAGRFSLARDPREAARGADVLITDVWASMGMEQDAEIRKAAFQGYQINAEMMALANPGAMVQHCLPAHKGEEITKEVFEAHADEIFEEAENRLHVHKAIMSLLMSDSIQ
ncbi:MAG: ornithine carbamoyltransferase, partial [Oscillospiraceae bacterium]|nr:ornithine carbamoyltransferase [Oscillospiraceae bacterium]